MSSGGSQTTASTPWGPSSPYLLDIMAQAQKQYQQQAPNYANPAGNFNYGNTTGAVGDAISGTTPFGSMASSISPNTTAAIQKQLSGVPDYTAVNGALDAANQQTWNSFNNQELPTLNQNASFLGNPSGSIKDLNWATSQISNNMNLNAQQAYLGEYDKAQTAQANAMGLGANIAQGAGAQSLQGASQYSGLAQLPQSNLADYAGIVSGTGGKFGTATAQNQPGAGQTAANVIGGLTAGAGLVNSLFGTGSSTGGGAVGAIGSLFGGGVDTAAAGAAAGSAASGLGAGASAGMANTAADVAAANSAWLGGGAGASSAAGGAGAAGTAAGTGSAAGASAGAAPLGALAGGAAAAGLFAAPVIYGASRNPVDLHASYWSGLESDLQTPHGAGSTPQQQATYYNALTQLIGMSGSQVDGPEAQQMMAKYGISVPNYNIVNNLPNQSRVGNRQTNKA